MHKKMVSLWRFLRTPVLLTSATVFVIGCASKNPLIDEAEPSEDTEKVTVATEKTDRTAADSTPPATDAGVRESTTKAETAREPDTLSEPAMMEERSQSDSMVAPSPAAKTVRQNDEISEKPDTLTKPVETDRRHPDNAVASSPATQTVLQDNEVMAASRTVSELSVIEQPQRQTVIEPMPAMQTGEALAENDLNTKPTGLKKWLNMLTPYKLNIQQGNFVSSEMLARVQYGMTKEQVRFVLGTPLLMDMFHANRWDYLFRLQKPNGATTTNRVTIFFSGNLVDRIVSDKLPNEKEYLMHITSDDEASDKTKKEADTETAAQETAEATETAAHESVDASAAATASGHEETTDAAEPQQAQEPSEDTATSGKDDSDDTDRTVQAAPVIVTQPVLRPSGAVRLPSASGASEPARAQQPRTAPVREQAPATRTQDTSRTAQEPVALPTPEPVRTPEPVSTSAPVRATEPSSQPKRIVRPLPRPPAQADYEDEEETSSGNIGAFEPISTPNRAGRMLPHSPNDELIGNIQ